MSFFKKCGVFLSTLFFTLVPKKPWASWHLCIDSASESGCPLASWRSLYPKKVVSIKPRFCPRKAQPMKIIQENRSKVWQELEAGRFFYPLQGTVIHIPTWGKGKSLTYHRLKSDLVGNFSEGIGLSHWIIFPLKKNGKNEKTCWIFQPPSIFQW